MSTGFFRDEPVFARPFFALADVLRAESRRFRVLPPGLLAAFFFAVFLDIRTATCCRLIYSTHLAKRFQRRNAMEINIVSLVPEAVLPVIASAKTRPMVPNGYGIQEQCLPFTSAAALGLLVRSPISFGYCRTDEIPVKSHGLRSPLKGDPRTCPDDELVFYVVDDPVCQFVRNTFHYLDGGGRAAANRPVFAPGLSFFDRDDQVDLFKLHLPYICRTDPEIDTLFLHPINRTYPFDVMSGLVETDWYSSAIDLVLRPRGATIHIVKGEYSRNSFSSTGHSDILLCESSLITAGLPATSDPRWSNGFSITRRTEAYTNGSHVQDRESSTRLRNTNNQDRARIRRATAQADDISNLNTELVVMPSRQTTRVRLIPAAMRKVVGPYEWRHARFWGG